VGTAAIQLAALKKAFIIVTAGTKEKISACLKLGAHQGIDYRNNSNFDQIIAEITSGKGINVLLDCVGGAYLEKNINAMARDGRLIIYGLLGGGYGNIQLHQILKKRLSIIATTLRNRSLDEKIRLVAAFKKEIMPFFQTKAVKPVIHKILPFEEAQKAHEILENNQNIGKVVLKMT